MPNAVGGVRNPAALGESMGATVVPRQLALPACEARAQFETLAQLDVNAGQITNIVTVTRYHAVDEKV